MTDSLFQQIFRYGLHQLNSLWLPFVIIAALLLIQIPFIAAYFVSRFAKPEELMVEQPDLNEGHAALLAHKVGCREWLKFRSFRFLTAFRFGNALTVVWEEKKMPSRFFIIQRFDGVYTFEFWTMFNDAKAASLETCSRAASFLPNPPGRFVQSITYGALQDIWDIHLRSEAFLIDKLEISPKPMNVSFREEFANAVRAQAAYTTSRPFWRYRTIYWYLLKRFLMANKTIEEQDHPPQVGSHGVNCHLWLARIVTPPEKGLVVTRPSEIEVLGSL